MSRFNSDLIYISIKENKKSRVGAEMLFSNLLIIFVRVNG